MFGGNLSILDEVWETSKLRDEENYLLLLKT